MDDATKVEIVEQLNEIIIDLVPDVTLRPMYGGTVIELKKGDPRSRVGGIYTYANYVSLEFSQGIFFEDSKHVLEGAGKLRRHVKIHELKDVKEKTCDDFLRQAILI